MKKRIIISLAAIVLAMCMCGCLGKNIPKEKDNDIAREVSIIVDAFDSKDVSRIQDLFFAEAMEKEGMFPIDDNAIEKFLQSYSKSQKVLVNCGAYLGGSQRINGKKFKRYSGVSAIIITEDNAYALNVVFYAQNKKSRGGVVKLYIESAKSEAYENLDYYNRNFEGDYESFTYMDEYDEMFDALPKYDGQYRVIWGKIIAYNDSTKQIALSEVENSITDTTTLDDIINEYGEYAASWNGHCHEYYYKLKNSNECICFDINDNNTVRTVEVTEELYSGWIEL